MEKGIIEVLEEYGFEKDEIGSIQKKQWIMENQERIIKKIESIYTILNFTDISNDEKKSFILNNISVLLKSNIEIIQVIYTWNNAGILGEAASRKRGMNCSMTTRTYLRNLYLNSKYNYRNAPVSYNALIMGDNEFSCDYACQLKNKKDFCPTYENLIYIYGVGDTFDERLEYIEDHIVKVSLKWFRDSLKKYRDNSNNVK